MADMDGSRKGSDDGPRHRPLMTEQEVADKLRKSRRQVRRYVEAGELRVVRPMGKGHPTYDPQDVDDFIERSKSGPLDNAPTWED